MKEYAYRAEKLESQGAHLLPVNAYRVANNII